MNDLHSLLTPQDRPLSKKRQLVAQFVMQNPKLASFASATEIADRAGVDPATVTRLAQSLGFDSFPPFQAAIRHAYLSALGPLELMRERKGQLDGRNLVQATLLQDVTNVSTALDWVDEPSLAGIAGRIVDGAQVLIVATGASGGVATIAAYLLQFLGLPARAEVRGGLYLATELALLRSADIVLGISFWRGARETVQALAWARQQNIETVALTDSNLSPLAKEANHVLLAPSEGTSFFQSMTAALSLIYCLVALVADRMPEERRTHQERIAGVVHDLGTMHVAPGPPRNPMPAQGK
jgi:DNA-binding MurR/RpiR family transcriptional regulator